MNYNFIYLPGSSKQLDIFLHEADVKEKHLLVIGAGSEYACLKLKEEEAASVTNIVEDYDSLIRARMLLNDKSGVKAKMMDFDNTDFKDGQFDIIYAQASVSGTKRNKIIKEIKRILKPESIFCAGENVNLQKEIPAFVKNIWNNSLLNPIYTGDIEKNYEEKGFTVLSSTDISNTLHEFYEMSIEILREKQEELTDSEKSYYKKLLHKFSHESNAYLNLGGKEYMGFKVLILKKGV